jgi:hypothetical protein
MLHNFAVNNIHTTFLIHKETKIEKKNIAFSKGLYPCSIKIMFFFSLKMNALQKEDTVLGI